MVPETGVTQRRKKILLGVTSDTSLGLMEGFPEYLAANALDVHLVSAPGPRNARRTSSSAVTSHSVPMVRDPRPLADLRALLAWVRLLRQIRPDVISVGTPKAGLLGILAGVLTRVPHRVYMLRGLRYETATGLSRKVLVFLERVACWGAHSVLSVSGSMRDRAVSDRIAPPSKITVLGAGSSNGVDLERFATTPSQRLRTKKVRWPEDAETPVVGYIGRLHEDKGLDLLLDAARIIKADGIGFRLLIVGGQETDRDYPSEFGNAGLSAEFTGAVHDVAPFLREMDLLCLPTKREGFPNVVLEASASGIPTIATLATGISDAIVNGRTGLIAATRAPTEMAALLTKLINDADLRIRLGSAAEARVKNHFARPLVWDRHHRYYLAKFDTGRFPDFV